MTTRLHILRPDVPTGPLTRGECREWTEACQLPCRHNLQLAGAGKGHARVSPPVPASTVEAARGCALNLADAGSRDNVATGKLMGVSKQAVDAVLHSALRKLARLRTLRRLLGEHDAVGDVVGAMCPSTEGL